MSTVHGTRNMTEGNSCDITNLFCLAFWLMMLAGTWRNYIHLDLFYSRWVRKTWNHALLWIMSVYMHRYTNIGLLSVAVCECNWTLCTSSVTTADQLICTLIWSSWCNISQLKTGAQSALVCAVWMLGIYFGHLGGSVSCPGTFDMLPGGVKPRISNWLVNGQPFCSLSQLCR